MAGGGGGGGGGGGTRMPVTPDRGWGATNQFRAPINRR